MSAPFFDLELIRTALAPVLTAGLAREIEILGSVQRAGPTQALRQFPSVLIVTEGTDCEGPRGVGNGRFVRESFALVLHLRQTAPNDATAGASLAALRSALWEILEGNRLDLAWAPLRYDGGQLLAAEDTLYSWLDRYSTETAAPTRPRS